MKILQFRFSKEATKMLMKYPSWIMFSLVSKIQISWEILSNLCSLLRRHELYNTSKRLMQNLRVPIYSEMDGSVQTKVFFYLFINLLRCLFFFKDLNFDCQSWLFFHPEFFVNFYEFRCHLFFLLLKNDCIFLLH